MRTVINFVLRKNGGHRPSSLSGRATVMVSGQLDGRNCIYQEFISIIIAYSILYFWLKTHCVKLLCNTHHY